MSPTPWQPNTYPVTRRSDHVDVYKSESKGEVKVPDPYNWLEQNTEETDAWTTAQEKFTRQYLDQYSYRDKLEEEFKVNSNYAKVLCMYCEIELMNEQLRSYGCSSLRQHWPKMVDGTGTIIAVYSLRLVRIIFLE